MCKLLIYYIWKILIHFLQFGKWVKFKNLYYVRTKKYVSAKSYASGFSKTNNNKENGTSDSESTIHFGEEKFGLR